MKFNNALNLTSDRYIYYFIIIFITLWSIAEFDPQTAVDGGLIISKEVIFPEQFNNVTSIYFNGWNTLHQISAILIKIGISQNFISYLFVFTSAISLLCGLYLILYSLTDYKLFSIIVAIIFFIIQKHFGHVDYPTLTTSEHTYGLFTFSLFTLILGLLSQRNFKFAGFVSTILLGFHLVAGAWVISIILSILIFSILLKKDNNLIFKRILLGFSLGLFLIFISLVFFYLNTIPKDITDRESFEIYMNLWDHHRNIEKIHVMYLLKTFVLILFCSVLLLFNRFKINENYFVYFLLFSALFSSILYLLYKFYFDYFPEFIIRAMPSRLIGLHSIVGYPVIIGISVKIMKILCKKFNLNLKFLLTISFFGIFSYYSFFHHEKSVLERMIAKIDQKVLSRVDKFSNRLNSYINNKDDNFWNVVKAKEFEGFVLTNAQTTNLTLRKGFKPYIINASFIDHLPYHPYTIGQTRMIIENVYGVNFENPPSNYRGAIKDVWYKDIFEKRSIENWYELSNEYNLSAIILPIDWKINLKATFSSDKFSLYIF